MRRLLIHVEGQTEETFVNELLRGHLSGFGYTRVDARLVGNARLRHRRGGIRAWPSVRKEIVAHLTQDRSCIATTMVDYYALPQLPNTGWPGRAEAASRPYAQKADTVETAIRSDLGRVMGGAWETRRFIPFVVMHEFEALLFSDCRAFARGIGRADLETAFQSIRDNFCNPEEINDSPLTAPSKRVESLIPHYEKPLLGTLAALEIGLSAIRQACPHFDQWLTQLEAAAS